jgi:hypothetical protein
MSSWAQQLHWLACRRVVRAILGAQPVRSLLALEAAADHLVLVESNVKCSSRFVDVTTLNAAYGSTVGNYAISM